MTIDFVIPNYNTSELIKNNLPKILSEAARYQAGIIIVDDSSTLEDYSNIRDVVQEQTQRGEKITVIQNDKNYGFSTTVNNGVSKSTSDLIVLLNSDVTPEDNFLSAAIADFGQDPNLFAVGMMDKSVEEGNTVLRGRGLARWRRGLLVHSRGEVDSPDTFWISGGSSVIKRDIFTKLSGFDTIYNPFYWEDIDLSYRARKSGYNLKFENKSVVVHKHEEGSIKKNFKTNQVMTTAYRNQFIFVWKNITDVNLLLSHFFWLPFHLIAAILRMDSAFIIGFFSALLKVPNVMIKRSKQAPFYKRQDRDLI